MATNKKKIFKFKGNSLDIKEDKLMKYIDANTYFLSSVENCLSKSNNTDQIIQFQ